MRKFQVLPIRFSLKGNKYAKSRDIVSENQLTSPAVDLISAGFIKEVFDEVEEAESEVVVGSTVESIEISGDAKVEGIEISDEAKEEIVEVSDDAKVESVDISDDLKEEIKDIKKPSVKK